MYTRISTSEDFRNLDVYEGSGPHGGIYAVEFSNREYIRGFEGLPRLLAIPAAFVSGIFLLVMIVPAEIHPFLKLVLVVLVVSFALAIFDWAVGAATIRRRIELDIGADRLRVLKNGRVETERQLTRMANLTIEDHPDAEYKRAIREQAGKKGLSDTEKQHCLMGWFGVRGSEQVLLLCRAEWPRRNSLAEVREAILWARDYAAARRLVEETPSDAGRFGGIQPQGGGMNPPLD